MKRLVLAKLVAWKQTKNRKPLILKGARQVGKTYVLREFARSHFPKAHYFNFEKDVRLASVFQESLDPRYIIQSLGLYQQADIDIERDLVIFDEIQACPAALTSLKYFCEDLPEMHICAAGSLLGVYLNAAAYPVGKVNHIDMYPMTFGEFLLAAGDQHYFDLLQSISTTHSKLPTIAHQHLWHRLQHYFITGGLPEVVATYIENKNQLVTAFDKVRKRQNDLIEDYFADISKHSGKINAMHINRIWRSIPEQLARTQDSGAKKFKFKGVIPGIDRYSKLVDALDWLQAAGLVLKVNIVNRAALPLKAYTKDNIFKLFLFDIGLLGAMSEITPQSILNYDYGSYKGFFAENYVAQAFTFTTHSGLYSWTENTSEVEFVRQVDNDIIPVEVKAGWIAHAKSLNIFVNKYHPPYRVIMSAKPLHIDPNAQLQKLPLYLAEWFPLS